MRTRLFIDFWNFTLQWKHRVGTRKHDWSKIPTVLIDGARDVMEAASLGGLTLEVTRVYASYEPERDEGRKLRTWLDTTLDRQPGVRVFTAERHWKQRPVHCRFCGKDNVECQHCSEKLGRAAEKTVDARIVTDLMDLAWAGAYDLALLVSCDKDFIPAVNCLQTKNFRVINATWRGLGQELAKVCWASFEIDKFIPKLIRKDIDKKKGK